MRAGLRLDTRLPLLKRFGAELAGVLTRLGRADAVRSIDKTNFSLSAVMWHDAYDAPTAALVRAYFRDDFERLGYAPVCGEVVLPPLPPRDPPLRKAVIVGGGVCA